MSILTVTGRVDCGRNVQGIDALIGPAVLTFAYVPGLSINDPVVLQGGREQGKGCRARQRAQRQAKILVGGAN